jgi:hypothetical protein
VPKERSWRVFQLAFLLLNLDGVTNLHHPHRSDPSLAVADLLWFPTGGGKTEAYLGLAAYTMGLRRLQGEIEGRSGEHGVAVLMRYTLRLLTLQQFQRAAALICACETIRQEAVAQHRPIWGHEPFRIGLWVGARSTPNTTEQSAEALRRLKKTDKFQPGAITGSGSPVQLKNCPWCGSAIDPGRNVRVDAYPRGSSRTLTFCGDPHGVCPFTERNARDEGLPVIVVDEEIYHRPPDHDDRHRRQVRDDGVAAEVRMLFGNVTGVRAPRLLWPGHDCRRRPQGAEASPRREGPAVRGVRPPDLIIQDEFHLISGPARHGHGPLRDGHRRPLLVGRRDARAPEGGGLDGNHPPRAAPDPGPVPARVQVFPPQGLDVADSFFAVQRRSRASRAAGTWASARRAAHA